MNINSVPPGYGTVNTTQKTNKNKSTTSFVEQLQKQGATPSVAAPVSVKSPADMSMDEYKQYILGKISQIPRHPTRMSESQAFNISDKGFEAMKNDPEYEKYVLNIFETDFAVANPWASLCGGAYVVYNIGSTKEEYLGQSWYAGYQHGKGEEFFNKKAEDSFWVRRAKHQQEAMEWSEELSVEHQLLMQQLQERNHLSYPSII